MTDSSNFNQHSTARRVQQRKRIRVALLETENHDTLHAVASGQSRFNDAFEHV